MATWFQKFGSWLKEGFNKETRTNNGLGRFLDGIDNLWNKITGSGLTGAEREANEFSARQAELAFEREAEFYEKNQSVKAQITQQQEAGINPFSINGSASSGPVVSSSAPSSVTPTGSQGFDPIALAMQIAQYRLQRSAVDADNQLKLAQANDINTRLDWDSKSFDTNLSILQEQLKTGQLTNEQLRKNIDEMLPLFKRELESNIGLSTDMANKVYNEALEAFNRAEKLAQEVSEARDSWSDRKKSIASQAIIDDFEASTARLLDGIGKGEYSGTDDLLQSLVKILKYFVVKK